MSSEILPIELPDSGLRSTDVVCLGHALVDRLAEATPELVTHAGLEVGIMTLVDSDRAAQIGQVRDSWEEDAGGSAANTAAGIASFGGTPAFAGSVGADEAGRLYVADLEATGVRCVVRPVLNGHPTGVCHVLVGSDGKRTMATSLGAAGELAAEAVAEVGIGGALVVYVEGYLLDAPAAAALTKAVELAKGAGTLFSLSLSDPFVVDRHRDRVIELLRDGAVDILFGNEDEARSLTGAGSLDEALAALHRPGMLVVVTRGVAGSVAARDGRVLEVAAEPVERVVDTTGAGDLFAAGVLFGITRHQSVRSALRLGSLAASEIICHVGARPRVPLASLIEHA